MQFKYLVYDKNGRQVNGQVNAFSKDAAVESLQNRGYIIISIESSEKEGSLFGKKIVLGGVSNKDKVILTKQLATLFEAQVSAVKVFRMIGSESKNVHIKNSLLQIADDISDGSSVANALKKQPKVFSAFFVNMVASGEDAGKLAQTFDYMSNYIERSYALSSKVKGALAYPIFVIIVFIVVMYLMLTMVIPKIAGMLTQQGTELPTVTKVVLAISNFLTDYGFIFIAGVVVLGFFFLRYTKTKQGRQSVDQIKLSIPLVSKLYQMLFVARVANSFGMMLKSGVSMVKTIENTSKVVDNVVYQGILRKISVDVRDGSTVSAAMKKHSEFPSIFVQMVQVGEESGKVADILSTMAKFYEKEVLDSVSMLVTLIQPLTITLLGLGVGGLMAAVLLPIYSITGGGGL